MLFAIFVYSKVKMFGFFCFLLALKTGVDDVSAAEGVSLVCNSPLRYSRSKRSISRPPFTGDRIGRILPGPEAQQEFVDTHNRHRGNEKWAKNIQCMEWNDTLARDAQALADYCHFGHIRPAGQGQNIYLITGDSYSPKTACDAWQDEINWFEYNPSKPSTCSAPIGETCGHYTQLVWHDSTKVGCGAALCSNTIWEDGTPVFPGFSSLIVVCNYSPPGNYVNQPPYERGSQCCNCPAEKPNCVNGVCCSGAATTSCNAGAPKPKKRKRHTFFIKSQMHGKVLHVPSDGIAGTKVVMWHQHTKDSHQPNNTNQLWRKIHVRDGWYNYLSSYSTGIRRLVLTLKDCENENCAARTKLTVNAKLMPPNRSQMFKQWGGKLISAANRLVVHLPFKNDSDGAEVSMWYRKSSDDLNQKWIVEYPENFFYIKNKMLGKVLDIKGRNSDVVMWRQIKGEDMGSQHWRMVHCKEDWYHFQSALSNDTSKLALSISECTNNCKGGEKMMLAPINDPPTKNQMFKFRKGKILSVNGDLVLDIPYRNETDGAILQVWHNRSTRKDWNQRWILQYQ